MKPRRGDGAPAATKCGTTTVSREEKDESPSFDALDLHRIYRRQLSALKKFKRPSMQFRKKLEAYRSTLTECEAELFSENVLSGCRKCIAFCDSLERTIKDVMTSEPTRHGTRFLALDSPIPENLAGSLIIGLLRPHEEKKYLAMLRCAHLLAIVWPEIKRELDDSKKEEALLNRLRQAYLRSVRPPSNRLR